MAKQDDFSENSNQQEGNNADDNFGLPEIEYKPLESSEESKNNPSMEEKSSMDAEEEVSNKYSYTPEPEPKSGAPIIIALIIGLVIIVAGYLIYQYVIVPNSEKSKQEELARQREAERKRKEAEDLLARQKEEAERAKQQQAVEEVKPAVGTIETLTDRTGRYYVVVASAIDDDLSMDYAKKLSASGTSVKIVSPFGKSQFYRITIGDFGTFNEAQVKADELKTTYGNGVWVLKY